ncbi:MAG TPA: restriction endonuclease [Candidatus Dormibacteraeota bacterium]|nr:restriction endonuclease [Candidatus Dormibacteraeota bacterium]
MARSYRRHSDDHVGFILVILVTGAVWAHRAVLTRVEHYLPVIWIAMAGIVGIVVITKLGIRINKNRRLHRADLVHIDNMTGLEFEKYVAYLLRAKGYKNVRLTEKYDLGVDIVATKDGVTWGIQVKRYSGLVKADAVRQVVTALKKYNCDQAMVITNSVYSKTAQELARCNGCVLIDRAELVLWVE